MQRMGRAGRRREYGTGVYLLIHQPWAETPDSNTRVDNKPESPQELPASNQDAACAEKVLVSKASAEGERLRRKLHPGVLAFHDAVVNNCYRATIFDFFSNESHGVSKSDYCCGKCNPEFIASPPVVKRASDPIARIPIVCLGYGSVS